MPTLKQLTCRLERNASSLEIREFRPRYGDGYVECYVAVPSDPTTTFSIRLTSSGYIAPGLAMFVYIDGVYQCNRIKLGLELPGPGEDPSCSDIDFRVRQKEEKKAKGKFIGREWRFEDLNIVSANGVPDSNQDVVNNVGIIEVVVLRCQAGLARAFPPSHFANRNADLNIQETGSIIDARAGPVYASSRRYSFGQDSADRDGLDPMLPLTPTPSLDSVPLTSHLDRLSESWPLKAGIKQAELLTKMYGPQEGYDDEPDSSPVFEQADQEPELGVDLYQAEDTHEVVYGTAAENSSNIAADPGDINKISENMQHPEAQSEFPFFGSLGLDGACEDYDASIATGESAYTVDALRQSASANELVAGYARLDRASSSGSQSAHVKSYWKEGHETQIPREKNRNIYVTPEEPLHPIPKDKARKKRVEHQVQPGRGASYSHRVGEADYIDSFEEPYAIFKFKYRSKPVLQRLLHDSLREQDADDTKARLTEMSKDEIIENYLQMEARSPPEPPLYEAQKKHSSASSHKSRSTSDPFKSDKRSSQHSRNFGYRGESRPPSNVSRKTSSNTGFNAATTAGWEKPSSRNSRKKNSDAGDYGKAQDTGGHVGQFGWPASPAPEGNTFSQELKVDGDPYQSPWEKDPGPDAADFEQALNASGDPGQTSWNDLPAPDITFPQTQDVNGDPGQSSWDNAPAPDAEDSGQVQDAGWGSEQPLWGDAPAFDNSGDLNPHKDLNASGEQNWGDTPVPDTSNDWGKHSSKSAIKPSSNSGQVWNQTSGKVSQSSNNKRASQTSNKLPHNSGQAWDQTGGKVSQFSNNKRASQASNKLPSNSGRISNQGDNWDSQSGNNHRTSQSSKKPHSDSNRRSDRNNNWGSQPGDNRRTSQSSNKPPSNSGQPSNHEEKWTSDIVETHWSGQDPNNDWEHNNSPNKSASDSGRRSNQSDKGPRSDNNQRTSNSNRHSKHHDNRGSQSGNSQRHAYNDSGRLSNQSKSGQPKSGDTQRVSNSVRNSNQSHKYNSQGFVPEHLSPIPEVDTPPNPVDSPKPYDCTCDHCEGALGQTWYHCKACKSSDICTKCIDKGKRCKNGNHNLAQWTRINTSPYFKETDIWIVAKGATASSVRESMRGSVAGNPRGSRAASARGSNSGSQTGWVTGGGGTYQGGNTYYGGRPAERRSERRSDKGDWATAMEGANAPEVSVPGSWPAGGGGGGGSVTGGAVQQQPSASNPAKGQKDSRHYDPKLMAWVMYAPSGVKLMAVAGKGGDSDWTWVPVSAAPPPPPWGKSPS